MRNIVKKTLSIIVCMVVMGTIILTHNAVAWAANSKTRSQEYAEAMGSGINLGNTFDAFDRVNFTEIDDETAWGNPPVTQAYMDDLKAKGFDSIRIPFTAFTRIGEGYTINETYLQRYETVVNYALNADLYVMVNLHHDSSEWLNKWDGNENSEEYVKFGKLWEQLAERFRDYSDKVMFESINEVCFTQGDDWAQNERVKKINTLFYNTVRNTGGNNATRMLVFPTLYTNHSLVYSSYLANYIKELNDENIMATVHYYSTDLYAFTINAGVSLFDETYNNTTARNTADVFYNCLKQAFVDNGIGVTVGEYGLFNMGYSHALEDGEVVKFVDYMNYKARDLGGINLMLWECGNIIDRNTFEYTNAVWGNAFSGSMQERCSYAAGLDEVFVDSSNINHDITIPLTLNGNTLLGIYEGNTKLNDGADYTYSNGTVTVKGTYVSRLDHSRYGEIAKLRFVFSAGSDWYETINYVGTSPALESINSAIREDDGYMSYYDTDGTPTYPVIMIPMDYQGKKIRRISSYDPNNNIVSSNSWASMYMQVGAEYIANYEKNELLLMNWYNNAIGNNTYRLVIEFYDGSSVQYSLTKQGAQITGYQMN